MCGRSLLSSISLCRIVCFLLAVCSGGVLFSLVAAERARGQVVINEIYYDHPGSDAGFEFIELMNVGAGPAPLKEYSIEFHNGAGEGWTAIWSGAADDSIAAAGLFLIGGSSVIPAPDSQAQLNLQNGPDAIRLLRSGAQADLVGYGSLDDPFFYEAQCAPDVPAGMSLGRMPDGRDTDDNLMDFQELVPSPARRNLPRTDLSIHADPGSERVIESEGGAPISLYVRNNGVAGVGEDEFVVEVRDSSALSVELLARIAGPAVAPGESRRIRCDAFLRRGHHWITALLQHPDDERAWNDTLTMVVRAGYPGVVISEAMSYPREGCPQYIELYNSAGEPVDLAGWRIRDGSHEPQTIVSAAHVLASHAYAVVTSDGAGLAAAFSSLDPERVIDIEGSWPYLNHTGSGSPADSIVIADRYGLPVDRTAYPGQDSGTRGTSFERADLYPGARTHTWVLCAAPEGGTPGVENRIFIAAPLSGGGIAVTPNPFELGRESLLIEIPRIPQVERVIVSIYDIHGLAVHEAGVASTLPAVFVWDGKRTDGSDVGSGIYVVACEEFLAGNKRRVERVVVGCGKSGSKRK
jgi:hypothetical protein